MPRKLRVGICEITGREVIQTQEGDEWMCLHNNTLEQDAEEVKQFKLNEEYHQYEVPKI
jgi:hypothetical protein